MLFFVQHMTPRSWVAGAANAHNYLITQPYVALLYFKTFFWPSGLSADYDLNPFTTTDDPRFWAGFAFIFLFTPCAIALSVFKKTRLIGFRFALVSDRASADVAFATGRSDERSPDISSLYRTRDCDRWRNVSLARRSRESTTLVAAKIAATCRGRAASLRKRLRHVSTEQGLENRGNALARRHLKSPRNGRGLMNYGNTLMAKGDYAGALDYFHRAQQFTPQYSVLLINLAIAENATKQSAAAEQHFKEALRLAPSSPDSYIYYARYLLSHSRADEARTLLHSALELSPTDLTARDLLAQTNGQKANQPTTQLGVLSRPKPPVI